MSSPDQPDKRGVDRSLPDTPRSGEPEEAGSTEFGSFVSSSVKNSFRQLKRDAEQSATPDSTGAPRSQSRISRTRRRNTEQSEVPAAESRPVGRKWRDAVDGAPAGPSRAHDSLDHDEEVGSGGNGGFSGSTWFRDTFFDENGPTRKLYAAIIAIILILILIIFFATRDGDDNGGGEDDFTPTATTSNVFQQDRTATPPVGTQGTPPDQPREETPEPTSTPGVIEGGDNQKDGD